MNRRAFLISVCVVGLGAVLLLLYLHKFETEKSGGELIRVLVMKKAVERGKPIVEDDLGVREVPVAYVEDRAIRASDRETVIGLRAGVTVNAQQTLMWTDLSVANEERRDLSTLVTPGNRAVHVRAARDDRGSGLIRPGDHVDVIATLAQAGGASSAVVLLQKVLVLANGTTMSSDVLASDTDKSRSTTGEQGLTLSLNLQETQLISLASERGQLTVALRHPDDLRTFDGIPDMSPSALTDGRARAAVQGTHRAAGPVKLEAVGAVR